MKIAAISRQDTGVGLYRLMQPTQFIDKVNKEKSRITPFSGTGRPTRISDGGDPNIESWNDDTLMEICKDADIIWSTIIYDKDEMVKMLDIRKWSGAKWIVDIDDDLYSIPVDNPNKAAVESLVRNAELCLSLADGLTVSVPRLKEVYRQFNPYIYVNPNGQDIKFWDDLRKKLPIKNNKKVRIGWRGASGHAADVSLIKPAIDALKKEYNIEFVTLGIKPPFKSEHHDWVNCLDFPEALAKLNLDMALVPLIDSPYNQSKSDIAIQEFSMLKIPVVASRVENQKNWPCKYAGTNYEWYGAIEELIKSRELRKKIGQRQYDHCVYTYDLKKQVKPLQEWFESVPRKEI